MKVIIYFAIGIVPIAFCDRIVSRPGFLSPTYLDNNHVVGYRGREVYVLGESVSRFGQFAPINSFYTDRKLGKSIVGSSGDFWTIDWKSQTITAHRHGLSIGDTVRNTFGFREETPLGIIENTRGGSDLWNLVRPLLLTRIIGAIEPSERALVGFWVLSPDTQRLVMVSPESIWYEASGNHQIDIFARSSISGTAFSSDSSTLAIIFENGLLVLIDLYQHREVFRSQVPRSTVQFSPRGDCIIGKSAQGYWNLRWLRPTRQPINYEWLTDRPDLLGLAFNLDQTEAVMTRSNDIRFLDIRRFTMAQRGGLSDEDIRRFALAFYRMRLPEIAKNIIVDAGSRVIPIVTPIVRRHLYQRVDPRVANQLISDLGNPRFQEREAAQKELLEWVRRERENKDLERGPVVGGLRSALSSESLEIRIRSQRILDALTSLELSWQTTGGLEMIRILRRMDIPEASRLIREAGEGASPSSPIAEEARR